MANLGAIAAINGYDYQYWFIADHLRQIFFDKSIRIQAEAKVIYQSSQEENNKQTVATENYVDDLIVYKNGETLTYNIKYIAPSGDKWTTGRLQNQGVIAQIEKQFKKNPNVKIVFVSQSDCPLFSSIFPQLCECKSPDEISLRIKNKNEFAELQKFKKYIGFMDEELIELSKWVIFVRGYEPEVYKNLIKISFKGKITKEEGIIDLLYSLAKEIGGKSIVDQEFLFNKLEKNGFGLKTPIDLLKAKNNFDNISSSLLNWSNIFGKLNDSHIVRSEVQKVIEWINKPVEEKGKPILLITGKAGCGKTIILQDVIKSLRENNTIVIGIKIDLMNATNFNELNFKLNLEDDFIKIINTITDKEKCVIVIDQIDSISLALSNDRSTINFYFDLINRLSNNSNLKLIISCRDYDLVYDPLLRHLDKGSKIAIGDLNETEIKSILTILKIDYDSIPVVLKKLISNSQNLNIFCSIYEKDIDLNSISTIQDLYNELWKKKVLSVPEKSETQVNILGKIAYEMANNQKLHVSKLLYEDAYFSSLNYFLSEGILKEEKNLLQFFHQSFFEYCFARTFVNKGESISDYILTQHQGLFIRSTLKNVLSYLRGINEKEYMHNLAVLLTSEEVRFHVKLLLFNILGSEENILITEMELIQNSILSDSKYSKYFIDSVRSIGWFHHLERSGIIVKYLKGSDIPLKLSCEWMIAYRLVEIYPDPILKFLSTLENNETNNNIIFRAIFYLKNWNNPLSTQLFDRVKEYFHSVHQYHLAEILIKIIKINPHYVANFLNKIVLDKVNAPNISRIENREIFGREISKVFEELSKEDRNLFLDTALPLIKLLSEKTKYLEHGNYHIDWAFYGHEEFRNLYAHWSLLNLVSKIFIDMAQDPQLFTPIFNIYKDDLSLTVIYLLTEGLLSNPNAYLDEIFYLLSKDRFLNEYYRNSGLRFNILSLIGQSYQIFDIDRQIKINTLILGSENLIIKKVEERKWKGGHIHELICSIPEAERKIHPNINKLFKEYKRKFGVIQNTKPQASNVSFVGSPIPSSAYNKMKLKDWDKSFKKYDSSTGWGKDYHNKRGFHFGGLVEHSRMFGASVKSNPEKFYPLLLRNANKDIASEYFQEALKGLVESQYDVSKIKELVKRLIKSKHEKSIRMAVVGCIEYIDKQEVLDANLYLSMCKYSYSYDDIEKNNSHKLNNLNASNDTSDSLHDGINTIAGFTAFSLVKLKSNIQYKDKLLKTLTRIANSEYASVKCAAIVNLHLLVDLDREKIFDIYLKLTKDLNEEVLINSSYLLGIYVVDKFDLLKDHIKAIAKVKLSNRARESQIYVGQIVMYLYDKNVRGAKKLLDELYNSSDNFKAGLLKQSIYLLSNKKSETLEKAEVIFKKMIGSREQVIQNEYVNAFREFRPEDFNILFKYILLYSKAKPHVGKRIDNEVFEYLLKCVGEEPKKCLEILEKLIETSDFDLQHSYISEEPVQVLIGAYNKLRTYYKNDIYTEKAMDIFDRLLQIPGLQHSTHKVLKDADYS